MYIGKSENKSKTQTTWICARRVADSCHAILKTSNGEVSTLAKPHNHPSDKTAVYIEPCRHIMKQQAHTSNNRPNQILTFSTATARDEVKARLPEPDTVRRVLRRFRAQHIPLEVANHISNIFVRYDQLCICFQFILVCK